jgi:tetratricopeptide (TPR) repeat protein
MTALLVILLAAQPEPTARELYERGVAHYKAGDIDAAIEDFKGSYRLSAEPTLLYDIAELYRKRGDCSSALDHYQRFLKERPEATNRAKVESRIAEMNRCVGETHKPAPPPEVHEPVRAPPIQQPPQAAVPTPAPPAGELETPGHGKRTWGIVLGAGGVAMIGTAVYFSLQASSASDEVSQLLARGGTWNPHYQSVESDGQRYQTTATLLYAAGGAAVASGVLLYYLGGRENSHSHLAATPLAGGFGATWFGSF